MICKKFISIIFRSIERLDKTSEPPRTSTGVLDQLKHDVIIAFHFE